LACAAFFERNISINRNGETSQQLPRSSESASSCLLVVLCLAYALSLMGIESCSSPAARPFGPIAGFTLTNRTAGNNASPT